jgi:hypothetical protein
MGIGRVFTNALGITNKHYNYLNEIDKYVLPLLEQASNNALQFKRSLENYENDVSGKYLKEIKSYKPIMSKDRIKLIQLDNFFDTIIEQYAELSSSLEHKKTEYTRNKEYFTSNNKNNSADSINNDKNLKSVETIIELSDNLRSYLIKWEPIRTLIGQYKGADNGEYSSIISNYSLFGNDIKKDPKAKSSFVDNMNHHIDSIINNCKILLENAKSQREIVVELDKKLAEYEKNNPKWRKQT